MMARVSRAGNATAILLAAATLAASAPGLAAGFPYRVLHRISLSGAASVQALAFGPGGKRLYAAAGHELRSYDTATGEPGPEVALPGIATGLAAAQREGGVLYAATRAPARLVILALRPLRVTSSIPLHGGEPSALLYDSQADALYVESRGAGSVTRLDPRSGRTLAIAHLRGRLGEMAANGRGMLYVADPAGDALQAIETGKMRRAGAIPLTGCSAPTGLAMDPVGRRLFVACGNGEALVVDEDMGFTFVRLPIARAASLQAVFAFHPLGPGGWKGGAFVAGDGPALDAIRMKAFINYVAGGSLPLAAPCTALAVSPAARQLALALAPRGSGGVELLMLGGTDAEVSQ